MTTKKKQKKNSNIELSKDKGIEKSEERTQCELNGDTLTCRTVKVTENTRKQESK